MKTRFSRKDRSCLVSFNPFDILPILVADKLRLPLITKLKKLEDENPDLAE
ncbi:MAG: hypothetical protein PVI90_14035 [Desulfobacteraceae bacterium]|jgi:hypothetical protein